jgi:class 3 adenylate cyclase
MGGLPSGTVTLLFTDIDGSTELVKGLRERYHEVLAEHRRLLRSAFADHGGSEIDTQGDAFFVVFGGARAAAAAAVAAQRALAGHQWPDDTRVLVRMGLHTTEPYLGEERYAGVGLTRAARLCTLAHGGQVLLSRTTAGILDDEEIPGVVVRDLGQHPLKDIARLEQIFQLVIEGLPSGFPPLQTLDQQAPLSGTVTAVVTDLRHSLRLFRRLGSEEFGSLLSDYRRLLRGVLEEAGGRNLEFGFDSVMAAFPTAKTAALSAAAAQRALARHVWPAAETLEMSVGLHSGEAGVGWLGPAVNRCVALCDSARPGQILLSQATASLLEDEELGGLSLRDLGEQSAERPQRLGRVYELVLPESTATA